jgi:ferredoxin
LFVLDPDNCQTLCQTHIPNLFVLDPDNCQTYESAGIDQYGE